MKPGMRLLYYAALESPERVMNDRECFLAHALLKGIANQEDKNLLQVLVEQWFKVDDLAK